MYMYMSVVHVTPVLDVQCNCFVGLFGSSKCMNRVHVYRTSHWHQALLCWIDIMKTVDMYGNYM